MIKKSGNHASLASAAMASLLVFPVLIGCQSASEHSASVNAGAANDRISVGTVQRQIRVGMTSSEVVEALGSPNMVTTDENRNENWVYDKVSTQTAYSSSVGGVNALFFSVGGVSGATSTSQRTLTIIIKFDGKGLVRDFAYRSSSF
jgi:outer membrane protein assembly factor BamE (lipoprotein component of BamABCDE complex)